MVRFVSATPSFPVSNLAASTAFYVQKLNFEPIYQTKVRTLLMRDEVGLMLRLDPPEPDPPAAMCRIGVNGVRGLYKEFKAAGLLSKEQQLRRTDWGKDEFKLHDPDGNTITFFSA